ncbi:MAG: hypothetical protein ABIR30_11695 [Chitinophagaceae bacterium]
MKNRNLVHSHQQAKIYRHYYRSSINPLRLLKSVLAVLISGSPAAASTHYRRTR